MTREPALDEKISLIHAAFSARGVPHAFGGALALAYYAEPRATIDIDVNVFVSPRRAGRVLDTLSTLGATIDRSAVLGEARTNGQARVRWGRSPLDLFFSYDPFHDACAGAARQVPFGSARIPILAPEHLVVCKAVFDRRKDWLDIEQILFVTAPEIDTNEITTWVERIVGADDRRAKRVRRLITRFVGARSANPPGRMPSR